MGRTVEPYSQRIKRKEAEKSDFRRGLTKPKQELFDEILREAKRDLAAGVMGAMPYSDEPILWSAIIVLKSEIRELKEEVARLKSGGKV